MTRSKTLKIGLTGGIGSGKNIVSEILREIGYSVFNSDNEAKQIMQFDPEVKNQIVALLGEASYNAEGLNKAYIASQIFQNDELRNKLNAIVHPVTRLHFEQFVHDHQDDGVVFNEAAILFETGAYRSFDKTILVTAPEELRINRVVRRDQTDAETVRNRIRAQWSDEKKIALTDYELINDDRTPLLAQIERMLSELQ